MNSCYIIIIIISVTGTFNRKKTEYILVEQIPYYNKTTHTERYFFCGIVRHPDADITISISIGPKSGVLVRSSHDCF